MVDYGNFFVILQRSSEHRHIETTKRYDRLANGNVRNFYCNARTVYDGSRV